MASEPVRFLFDGEWIAKPEAGFPMLNRAFRFGDGCFETLRVRGGKILFLEAHLNRLCAAMQVLGFEGEHGNWKEKATFLLSKILQESSPLPHARLRLEVIRIGEGAYRPESDKTHWIVEMKELEADTYLHSQAISLTDFPDFDLSPGPFSGLKLCNALPYVLAARHAKRAGFDETLFWNKGSLVEAAASNVFLLKGHQLFTPPLSSGCLAGVMRNWLLENALDAGLTSVEKEITARDLEDAEAILLTNVVQGLRQVQVYRGLRFEVNPPVLSRILEKLKSNGGIEG